MIQIIIIGLHKKGIKGDIMEQQVQIIEKLMNNNINNWLVFLMNKRVGGGSKLNKVK